MAIRKGGEWTDTVKFAPLFIRTPGGQPEAEPMWCKAGPGDNMELVMTAMLIDED